MATTKVTTDVIDMSGNAGGLTWVKGTTAQRTTTTIGDLREDTDTKRTQVYTDQSGTAEWRNLKEETAIISFNVEYLVVAGGGGGGSEYAAGGGAGGYRTSFGTVSPITISGTGSMESSLSLDAAIDYTITVGPGGAGAVAAIAEGPGATGTNSVLSGTGITTITSTGGGGGGNNSGTNGGSGGGAGCSNGTGVIGNAVTSPVVQGFNGGNRGSYSPKYPSGGGGGAAEVGESAPDQNTAGDGGAGLTNAITVASGTGPFYAGGGGGGGQNGVTTGSGGSSIGGNGTGDTVGGNGNVNTGSGGGGGGSTSPGRAGGNGGSGIVILRCTKATATLGSGITVNSTAGPGSVNGVAISGTSDYYYSATLGSGTITFS